MNLGLQIPKHRPAPSLQLLALLYQKDRLALLYQGLFTGIVRVQVGRQLLFNPESLRKRTKIALQEIERDAALAGYDHADVQDAHFAVVAFLDEVVLNSVDDMRSEWLAQTLQQELFGHAEPGVVFFEKLERLLSREDSLHLADLLEVYVLCLQLGFEGRHSGSARTTLVTLAEEIRKRILKIRGSNNRVSPSGLLPRDDDFVAPEEAPGLYLLFKQHLLSFTNRIADRIEGRSWRAGSKRRADRHFTREPRTGSGGPFLVREHAAFANPAERRSGEAGISISRLLQEASANLARIRAQSRDREGILPLSRMPFYLVVGPKNSGKTSTFLNAGLDVQLLAGSNAESEPGQTGACSLWLAGNAVFIEISGTLFSGELDRWTRALHALASSPARRGRQFRRKPDVRLQGVIAFADAKTFVAANNKSGTESLNRCAKNWQERLRAIAEAFSTSFPVYLFVSKSDTIPYFPDYFRRISLSESNQVLGCTLRFRDVREALSVRTASDALTRKLNDTFSPLYRRLAEQRLSLLPLEADTGRRAGIYEFPREFERLKAPLVQFMATVFSSNPMRKGPLLRGFYFTGLCETGLGADPGVTMHVAPRVVASGANVVFRSDATRIFRPGDDSAAFIEQKVALKPPKWVFAAEVFKQVILADPLPSGKREVHLVPRQLAHSQRDFASYSPRTSASR